MSRPDSVVYLIAKAPRPGASKTRLCPPLDTAQAAALARAFLLDSLDTVLAAGCAARIMCRDDGECAALRALVGEVAPVALQDGHGLGDALESSFRQGLSEGFAAAAVLGADSPTLPAALIREAFAALRGGSDVALGPTDDGGYYLLAATATHPRLFRNMVWSTSSVAAVTLERCRALGLRVHLLPRWYDVDDAAALDQLLADLRQTPGRARHTRAALIASGHLRPPSSQSVADGVLA